MDPADTQIADALILAKADLAIDQLDMLQLRLVEPQIETIRKALRDASNLIKELKAAAKDKTSKANSESPRIFYSSLAQPTEDIKMCTTNMRVGKPREIKRFVEISPVWASRVNDAKDWDDRFRIVDSLEAACGLKVLHNINN